MDFRKHDIIDYYDGRRIASGLVLDIEDKRLRILTDQGKEMNIPQSRAITRDRDALFPVHASRDAQIGRLKEIYSSREELKSAINLAQLWEVVASETEEIDAADLAELFFGTGSDINSSAAMLRAIHEDRLYFRIKDHTIEVHDQERVEQALVQKEREQERKEFSCRCVECLCRIKGPDPLDAASAPEGLVPMLEQAAKAGKDWVTHKSVKEIFSQAGMPPELDPFWVLVKLGVWSEDENLTLRCEEIPVDFSARAQARAAEIAATPLCSSAEDLSSLKPVTIDAVYTRDVDDAISLTRDKDEAIVGIHITDVAHLIGDDKVMHEELRSRATSIYMPDLTIPMMPPVLSEQAASLGVGELRPAVSVLVRVGPDATIRDYTIRESVIRVFERLSYDEADTRILEEPSSREAALYRFALALRRKRCMSGAVIFKDPELSVRVAEDRSIEVKVRQREDPSQVMVSELMILANSLFARFLQDRGVPAIFRSQPPPLEKVELPEEYDPVISYRAKKMLSRGDLATTPQPHSTLGLELYTTATSPLRRYPDLVVQGQLKAAIGLRPPPLSRHQIETILSEVTYRLDRASFMERERQRYFLLKYLEARKSDEFEAVVLQRFPRFYLVQLVDFGFNAALHTGSGMSLSPYDRALVRIDRINPRDDKLSLAPVRLL